LNNLTKGVECISISNSVYSDVAISVDKLACYYNIFSSSMNSNPLHSPGPARILKYNTNLCESHSNNIKGARPNISEGVISSIILNCDNLNISIEDNYNVICTSIEVNIDVIIVISI